MGSRVSRVMRFHPYNLQLPLSFRSRLKVRHGTHRQTDGQTDEQTEQPSIHYAPPYGGGGIIKMINEYYSVVTNSLLSTTENASVDLSVCTLSVLRAHQTV